MYCLSSVRLCESSIVYHLNKLWQQKINSTKRLSSVAQLQANQAKQKNNLLSI